MGRICITGLLLFLLTMLFVSACNNANTIQPEDTTSPPLDSVTQTLPILTPFIKYPDSVNPVIQQPECVDLEFETVSILRSYGSNESPHTLQLNVISSKPVIPIGGIPDDVYQDISDVDFSQYIVIIAVHGIKSPGEGLEIKRIIQCVDTIYVVTRLQKPQATQLPTASYPYHIVKVNKAGMTYLGEIIFSLTNENGWEQGVDITHEILE